MCLARILLLTSAEAAAMSVPRPKVDMSVTAAVYGAVDSRVEMEVTGSVLNLQSPQAAQKVEMEVRASFIAPQENNEVKLVVTSSFIPRIDQDRGTIHESTDTALMAARDNSNPRPTNQASGESCTVAPVYDGNETFPIRQTVETAIPRFDKGLWLPRDDDELIQTSCRKDFETIVLDGSLAKESDQAVSTARNGSMVVSSGGRNGPDETWVRDQSSVDTSDHDVSKDKRNSPVDNSDAHDDQKTTWLLERSSTYTSEQDAPRAQHVPQDSVQPNRHDDCEGTSNTAFHENGCESPSVQQPTDSNNTATFDSVTFLPIVHSDQQVPFAADLSPIMAVDDLVDSTTRKPRSRTQQDADCEHSNQADGRPVDNTWQIHVDTQFVRFRNLVANDIERGTYDGFFDCTGLEIPGKLYSTKCFQMCFTKWYLVKKMHGKMLSTSNNMKLWVEFKNRYRNLMANVGQYEKYLQRGYKNQEAKKSKKAKTK